MRGASAIRRTGISNSIPRTIAAAGVATALLGIAGWSVARGHLAPIVALIVLAGVGRLALAERGVLIGILLLAAMNGIPELDTSHRIVNHFTAQDLAICMLILSAIAFSVLDRTPYRPTRAGRTAIAAATLLLAWCLAMVARTILTTHVPLLTAVAFARDYLYFALLLIVLPRMRLASRDIHTMLATLTAGVCTFAVAQIATALHLGRVGALIHVGHTSTQAGVTRVYADMTDLVTAGLALSVAAALSATDRRLRRIARPVALLLIVSVVVQLTRARWIGFLVAFLLVSVWFMLHRDRFSVSPVLRRRLGGLLGAAVLMVAVLLLAVPGLFSSGPFIHRVVSIFTTVENGGGTVRVREAVTRTMTHYLGGNWFAGIGFISPNTHYFLGLPNGSIEDPDLGVLNAIMPMGVIGAAAIYLPVVLVLGHSLRRSSGSARHAWLRYGGVMWIVATLISSLTLVTLFSTSGLALSAVLLTVLSHPLVIGRRSPMAASDDAGLDVASTHVGPPLPTGIAAAHARTAATRP